MLNFESVQRINIELLGPVNMYFAIGLEVMMAIFLGSLIGFDREKKLKSAGMKTHILICLGAMFFVTVSRISNLDLMGNYTADVNRVAAAVVQGIGFLGAGAIIQNQKGVFGLTSAATIWVAAAIGIAIGSGLPFSAAFFTLTVVFVLKIIDPLYKKISGKSNFYLEIVGVGSDVPDFELFMPRDTFQVKHREIIREDNDEKFVLHYYIKINNKDLTSLVYKIRSLEVIKNVNFREVSKTPYHEED